MKDNAVQVNDLHAFALKNLDDIQSKDGIHFTSDGSKVLATQVAESIQTALAGKDEVPR